VTLLKDGRLECAFDTGPGNIWIDTLVRWRTQGRLTFDRGGRLARLGKPDLRIVERLCRHPYFQKRPPKSAGWEEFGPSFLATYRPALSKLSFRDCMATVTHGTARATAEAYRHFVFPRIRPKKILVCGGGARNDFLLESIGRLLPGLPIELTDVHGVPAEDVEAISFALLAAETVRGRPGNEPRATGAKRPVVCGLIAPAGNARSCV
jgi:anhydro-N-acetylmuramic acid kinase